MLEDYLPEFQEYFMKEKIVIKGIGVKAKKITKKDMADLRKDESGKKYKNPPKIKRIK